jgi:photosystem I P700 chlorophyll a apoprotein A1
LFFRYINQNACARLTSSKIWSKAGYVNKALSKGPKTTTWIWNLHSDAHDFDMQQSSIAVITRKVFSSNLAHLSLVFFWISGMHFHGAYFSNYDIWLKDPKHYLPSAHNVWSLIGQDILNSDIGNYFQGIHITSGIFQLWRSEGIITQIHLKYAIHASLIGTIISCLGSYFHMHISWSTGCKAIYCFYKKFKCLSIHHLSVLFGLSSISWCGHQIHISVPLLLMLDSGIDPVVIISPQDLLQEPGFSIGPFIKGYSLLGQAQTAHHFYVGIVFITSSVIGFRYHYSAKIPLFEVGNLLRAGIGQIINSWHAQLSMNLAIAGSLSIAFAHAIYAIPIYPYTASDYPTVLCLFYHHMWVGGFLIIGAGAHASIFIIGDMLHYYSRCSCCILQQVLNHRDVIIAHLIWVSIALGLHSFSLYIHNDTLQAFGRPEDIFHDNEISSIQLKPVFAGWVQRNLLTNHLVQLDIAMLDKKVIRITQELGTADFIVHHIHAFTIHVALLILSKGILYARNSRLVSDKLELGFRYPCDGPGRGGTCQISPWDHIYLAVFWMYNSLSVVLFHYFWKMQSDVWGIYNIPTQKIMHISVGDFSVNSSTINGWLRNFLWSQAAIIIQSYGTSISGYGFIFILAHFIWAFSLMFLYSGRGYWQELIESILWAHHKLKIMPHIQPRALSISQGRAVGFIHYTLGGVGCTWAFFISRTIVLSIS